MSLYHDDNSSHFQYTLPSSIHITIIFIIIITMILMIIIIIMQVSFEEDEDEHFEVVTDENYPGQFRVEGSYIERVRMWGC